MPKESDTFYRIYKDVGISLRFNLFRSIVKMVPYVALGAWGNKWKRNSVTRSYQLGKKLGSREKDHGSPELEVPFREPSNHLPMSYWESSIFEVQNEGMIPGSQIPNSFHEPTTIIYKDSIRRISQKHSAFQNYLTKQSKAYDLNGLRNTLQLR